MIFVIGAVQLGCVRNNLKIDLLTQEILSKKFPVDSTEIFYNNLNYNNKSEKYLYTNVIKLKLSNNTDKKYLFFLKGDRLIDLYNIEMLIEDKDGNIIKQNAPLIDPTFSCNLASLISNESFKKDESNLILEKIGYKIRSRVQSLHGQETIINPNETVIFYSSLSLPFVIEDNNQNLRRPVYYKLNPDKKYTFRLKYELKEDWAKIIPRDILENYRTNNVEIFTAKIETEKIPIIFK